MQMKIQICKYNKSSDNSRNLMKGLRAQIFLLVTVGNFAKFPDSHRLLLNVVLCEKSRLSGHHLLNGCRYHQIIYVIIRTSGLPFLWWDHLEGGECTVSLPNNIYNQ